jgi:hypothetical protein
MENQQPNFEGEKMHLPENAVSAGSDLDSTISKRQGPVIIFLVIALAIILVGLFFWYQAMNKPVPVVEVPTRPTYETNQEPESPTAEAQVDSFTVMSTSDELGAIEADLESTNLDTLETELTQIDEELTTE